MQVAGCVALVTGAAGGIGSALVAELASRGAQRIYAADLEEAVLPESEAVVPLSLDVTDERAVQDAAERQADVTLVINNAAVLSFEGLIDAPNLANARIMFEVNFWGYLYVARSFSPVLGRNGGGALINVLSEAARMNAPFVGAYSATKAAAWSATQGIRAELRAQGTQVLAAFPSSTDTAMLAGIGGEKQPPSVVARGILDALEAGKEDISVGNHSVAFEALIQRDPKAAEAEFAALLPGAEKVPE
jgi:NAD(P)-dependent dehydrogenase (short-subunit alcohol dehydrogenase family)